MSKISSIKAGRAYVELFADNSKLIRGLRSAKKRLQMFGNSIRNIGLKVTAIGSLVAGPFVIAAKHFSSYGDQAAKMSKRTGVSVQTLSQLQYAASQTGTEFRVLENALRKMQKSIYDAGRGLSTAVDALADLGLSFEDLKDLSPEEQFKLLADRLSLIDDATRRAGIAMSLFGRTGTNLLPMFKEGAAGIEELQKQADKLGLTISSEDAKAAEDLTDAFDRLIKTIKTGLFRTGAAIGPALMVISDSLANITAAVGKWINQNRGFVTALATASAGIIALGVTLTAAGFVITGFGITVDKIASVFSLLASAVTFAASPLGITITAVAALGGALTVLSGNTAKAADYIKDKFASLKSGIIEAVSAAGNYIAKGDIASAAEVLWLLLNIQWQKGILSLKKLWLKFREFMEIGFAGFKMAFELSVNGMTVAFIEVVSGLKKVWLNFTSWWQRAVERTAGWLTEKWFKLKSLFDDSVDMEFIRENLAGQSAKRIKEIEAEKTRELKKAEKLRSDLRKAAQKESQSQQEKIVSDSLKKRRKLQDEHIKKTSGLEQKLSELKDKLADSISDSRELTKSKLSEISAPVFEGIDTAGSVMEKITVAGAFNPYAVSGLGTGSKLDTLIRTNRRIADNTEDLVHKDDNLRFS